MFIVHRIYIKRCSINIGLPTWYPHIYGCFQNEWYPQFIHFNRVWNHYKPSILGVLPLFLEGHPYMSIFPCRKMTSLPFPSRLWCLCRHCSCLMIGSRMELVVEERFKILPGSTVTKNPHGGCGPISMLWTNGQIGQNKGDASLTCL